MAAAQAAFRQALDLHERGALPAPVAGALRHGGCRVMALIVT